MRRNDQLAAVDQRHGRRKRPRVKHERNDKDEYWPQEWLAEEWLICIRIHGNAGKTTIATRRHHRQSFALDETTNKTYGPSANWQKCSAYFTAARVCYFCRSS